MATSVAPTKKIIQWLLKNQSDIELAKLGTKMEIKSTKMEKIGSLKEKVIVLKEGLMELDELSFSTNEEKEALLTCEGWTGRLIQCKNNEPVRTWEKVAIIDGQLVESP